MSDLEVAEKLIDTKQSQTELMLSKIEFKDGTALPKNLNEFKFVAAAWVQGGMVPKSYDTWAKVYAGLEFAVGLGLPGKPSSLRNICVINGFPQMFGELPLQKIMKSPYFEDADFYMIDKNKNRIEFLESWDQIYAAVCRTKRKNQEWKQTNWTRFQAEKAIHGVKAIWEGYYDIMMKRKCRAIHLKDYWTDVLGSSEIMEYKLNFAPDCPEIEQRLKDVGPSTEVQEKLKQLAEQP